MTLVLLRGMSKLGAGHFEGLAGSMLYTILDEGLMLFDAISYWLHGPDHIGPSVQTISFFYCHHGIWSLLPFSPRYHYLCNRETRPSLT